MECCQITHSAVSLNKIWEQKKNYSVYFRNGYNIQTCTNGNGWKRKLLDQVWLVLLPPDLLYLFQHLSHFVRLSLEVLPLHVSVSLWSPCFPQKLRGENKGYLRSNLLFLLPTLEPPPHCSLNTCKTLHFCLPDFVKWDLLAIQGLYISCTGIPELYKLNFCRLLILYTCACLASFVTNSVK